MRPLPAALSFRLAVNLLVAQRLAGCQHLPQLPLDGIGEIGHHLAYPAPQMVRDGPAVHLGQALVQAPVAQLRIQDREADRRRA